MVESCIVYCDVDGTEALNGLRKCCLHVRLRLDVGLDGKKLRVRVSAAKLLLDFAEFVDISSRENHRLGFGFGKCCCDTLCVGEKCKLVDALPCEVIPSLLSDTGRSRGRRGWGYVTVLGLAFGLPRNNPL